MEFSYLLLERRSSETLANVLNPILGTGWNADSLLVPERKVREESFTWSKRAPERKVSTPLTVALTQNPKFIEQIKSMARDLRQKTRTDSTIINLPSKSMLRNSEVVDLSYVPKDEFLKYARSVR